MTLRGVSHATCEWATGEPATWCAMAHERRRSAFWWLWCRAAGLDHCRAEWRHFYRGAPYRAVPLFR